MKNLIVILVCFLVAISCGKDKFDYNLGKGEELLKGEGFVEFSISTSSGVSAKSIADSKAQNLNVNDFSIEVYNSNNVRVKKWNKFSEITSPIKLNTGDYIFKAYYGDSTATGFDIVYFAGETKFKVEGQQNTSVSTVCKQANVKMKIVWGANLLSDYQDYTIKVYRAGFKDSLTFNKTEIREGYIPAGTLKFKVYLTDKKGNKRVYSSSTMDLHANPNDFITLTVNSKEAASYDVNLSFDIDSSTDDRVVDILIPNFMTPKEPPKISSEDIIPTANEIIFYDGVGQKAWININAPAYIESCIIKCSSPYLINTMHWPAEIDLASISNDVAQILKDSGLSWRTEMLNAKLAFIDFTEVTKRIPYNKEVLNNIFEIIVTDVHGQKGSYEFNIKPQQVTVSMLPIPASDIWSKYVYSQITTNVTQDDIWQVEANSGSGWNKVPIQVLSTEGDKRNIKITSLTPGTSYEFRVKYIPRETIVTPAVTGTMENAAQIPNGDMEGWSSVRLHEKGYAWDESIDCVFLNGGWSTRNERTTKGGEQASDGGLIASSNPNFGVYWRWYSGTVSTSDKTQGNAAAEISTMAFYNKKVSGSWKRTSVYSYTRDDGTPYVGYLFTGVFNKDADSYTLGIAHDSRPESISFDYKYTPCNGGDKCLAYAKLYNTNGDIIAQTVEFNSTNQASYVNQDLKFIYKDNISKAAKIVVFFQSGYDTQITNMHQVEGGYGASPFMQDKVVGSVLKVDNIVLNY